MKYAAAIIVALMTFTQLLVLNLGCEAVHDFLKAPPPLVYQIADAFSPIGATYFVISILAGSIAWFSDEQSYFWLIPAILMTLISFVLLRASSAFIVLDGDRPFSPYRYAANASLIAFELWLLIRMIVKKKRSLTKQ